MNWFNSLFEKRGRQVSSDDPALAEMMGIRESSTGQFVNADNAVGIAAVHACVQLIAETVASLPLSPYIRLPDGSKELDHGHPLFNVLHNQANRIQTAFEFREQLVASCLLTGNAYAIKIINSRGEIKELIPVHPALVNAVKLTNGRLRYEVSTNDGMRNYNQDEVLHLRYRTKDGITGLSPVTIARETIGIALAQQQHEGRFFKNGATLSGAIKHPGQLGAEAKKGLAKSFRDNYSGSSNAFKVVILDEGMDFQAMSMSQQDAQFIESKKMTLEDIARIYRIPPPAIGILDNATYSNITEQSRSLVMHTLRPWLVRIEQSMNACLLSEDDKQTHFIEHNAEGLLRGSIKERYEAYRIAREWGWLNPNEIRAQENMGGIGADGNTYRQPMNSEPLGAEAIQS
mgnify:CR=1 FL=1